MSVKIKINWDNENAVSDSVRIYRADSAFTSANLPPLLAEIFGNVYEYEDFDVVEGQTYYYMLSAKLGKQEAFTECFEVVTNIEQPLPNEMYFTTIEGSVNYVGTQGDQILLSDGTILDVIVIDGAFIFNVPSGTHKVILVESRDSSYVSIGGEALIELHNFPTLSSVNAFDTYPSPNLVKVPTVLPSNLISLTYMFNGATSFNQDISMWDVSNVTEMNHMFQDAKAFNQPLNNWDTSSVIYMATMFSGATSFNQDISSWDVSNVTQMPNMFNGATSFNQDLSQWCVPLITSKPIGFDDDATNWTLPRPVWGTCPQGGTPPYGNWILNQGHEIIGNDIKYTAYKTNGLNYYDSFALADLVQTLVKSFHDPDLQQYAAFTSAVEKLTGTSDWVLDPANNQIVYSQPNTNLHEPSKTCQYVYRMTTSWAFSGYIYGCSIEEVASNWCPAASDKVSNCSSSVRNNKIYLTWRCKSGQTCNGFGADDSNAGTPERILNPTYDPDFTDEKTLPLETVVQKVISNAESSEDEVLKLLSEDYINLVAESIFNTDTAKQFVKLEDLIPQLEDNKVLRN